LKIAIPVENEKRICQSFGRAPLFLIYDTELMESVYIDNNASNSQGGAGVKAAQNVVDQNVNILLTPQCGENALNVIKSANIMIYKTIHTSIEDNIKDFNEGKLSILETTHVGFHHHGGK